jgi:hypothetical protein
MRFSSGAVLLFMGYGVFTGIVLQRAGVPEKIAARTREFIDLETRRTARIMTEQIHLTHAELERSKKA